MQHSEGQASQHDPTTNDGIMDYSLEEEDPFSMSNDSNETPGLLPCPKKIKTCTESDRWFVVDDRGQIKFVDNVEDDFPPTESEFSSPSFSDSAASISYSVSTMSTTPRDGPCCMHHRRTSSDCSALTDLDHSMLQSDPTFSLCREAGDTSEHQNQFLELKLPKHIFPADGSRAAPVRVRAPLKLAIEQKGEESPCPAYIRDTKIPVSGWFKACRWCGAWTGSSLEVAQQEVPMCNRCQYKWREILSGADLSKFSYAVAGNPDDLLTRHVKMRLEENPEKERQSVCETAMLEIHQTWIMHNGEVKSH